MLKFCDPLEDIFREKFGLYPFDYVQKLIICNGYSKKEAYDNLHIEMDIIWLDMKELNSNDFVICSKFEDNPFLSVRTTAELHGFGLPSVKSAVG